MFPNGAKGEQAVVAVSDGNSSPVTAFALPRLTLHKIVRKICIKDDLQRALQDRINAVLFSLYKYNTCQDTNSYLIRILRQKIILLDFPTQINDQSQNLPEVM